MESIINSLNWREATKKFDPEKKLTGEQLDTLLEAARLSPSSYGLQPWSFVVVNDPETRAKLRKVSWDQSQVTDASHLIVFAAKMPDDALIDAYIADMAKTRGVTEESLVGFSIMMKGAVASMSEAKRLEWAEKQVYCSLGVVLAAAATLGIDSCPIEGFDAAKYDEILGFKELGLHATLVLPVGLRDESISSPKKVRFAKKELILEM